MERDNENHAHDSIGCCCSDKVHQEISSRFTIANEKVERMIDFYKRKITDAMPKDIALDKLTVFNLLPYPRNRVVRSEVITRMKSFKIVTSEGHEIDYQVINKEIIDAGLIDRQIVHYGNYDPFIKYTIEFKDNFPAMGYQAYLIQEAVEPKEILLDKVDFLEMNTIRLKLIVMEL